ncbi:hypothetical protein [Desulfogranum mediterraneum]|uniref:hypothetical protein n=1 Tax=Desulfogranum mediterraneum TaxID=160661 RepID=UPI0003FAC8BE|nr:hypothetical protein [Desulfogranum mediterraneum]
MADVSPEGRRKIEAIYHDYEHRIAAFQKYLTKVQKDFKKHLREDSDEEIIRKAFNPIAAAMEDLAVHQIMMIQEIKRVISSQLKAGREEQQALLSRNGTDDPHRPPLRSATQSQERGR